MSRRRDSRWRDLASFQLVARTLPDLSVAGPVLVMGDPLPDLPTLLASKGYAASVWRRRVSGAGPGSPWPPEGPFNSAFLRLPRSKEELLMQLHAAAAVLRPGGMLMVYGAKDEGIRGVFNHTHNLFASGETVAIGGRCRVVRSGRRVEVRGLRGALEDWKEVFSPGHPLLPALWVSYPGVFAHGRLDPGTKLLLEAMPPIPPGGRVLDYGCGSGFVASVARLKGENLTMDMLDSDAVALEAARENVPGARVLLQEGLPDPGGVPYEAILSNPPFHRGKGEESGLILEMIRGAPGLLTREGKLFFVSQRRFEVREALEKSFSRVSVAAEDSVFRVWVGERPRQSSQEGHHGT